MPFIAVALAVVLTLVALVPLSLVLRYHAGTARRRARGWVAVINVLAIASSTALFLAAAAVTSLWVPKAFTHALMGLAGGCLLGLLGIWLSRWETTSAALHYTPNRWLVLAIMLAVTSRLLYGMWRGWQTWRSALGDTFRPRRLRRGRLPGGGSDGARLLPGLLDGRLAPGQTAPGVPAPWRRVTAEPFFGWSTTALPGRILQFSARFAF